MEGVAACVTLADEDGGDAAVERGYRAQLLRNTTQINAILAY